jgi:AAA15 family ATPase/GTPase
MIHSLAIKNFTSFHEPTVVEFTAGPKAGRRRIFLPSTQPDVHVNAVTGIFGPNASGKTNLLKAIAFLRHFILNSASAKPDEGIAVEAFAFTDSPDEATSEPVHLCLEFEFEGQLYRYEVELNTKRVLSESLHRKDQRFRYLFERTWDDALNQYHFKAQDIGPAKHITLRENASFLASAVLQEHPEATRISAYFKALYSNIHGAHGRMPTHEPELFNILPATNFYKKNTEVFADAEFHLVRADLGISKLRIDEARFLRPDGKEEAMSFPVVEHVVGGKSFTRPLLQESRGTQSLFVLLRYILPVLRSGGVAVIDEFETGLHSHMVKAIVELFYSPESNPKGAQLIASFHTDYLLQSTLEKYQIVLTEKNPDTLSTEAWRLDQVKGAARNTNNHYAKYHAGAYGGIPNL